MASRVEWDLRNRRSLRVAGAGGRRITYVLQQTSSQEARCGVQLRRTRSRTSRSEQAARVRRVKEQPKGQKGCALRSCGRMAPAHPRHLRTVKIARTTPFTAALNPLDPACSQEFWISPLTFNWRLHALSRRYDLLSSTLYTTLQATARLFRHSWRRGCTAGQRNQSTRSGRRRSSVMGPYP
jgi:hypothetical protein